MCTTTMYLSRVEVPILRKHTSRPGPDDLVSMLTDNSTFSLGHKHVPRPHLCGSGRVCTAADVRGAEDSERRPRNAESNPSCNLCAPRRASASSTDIVTTIQPIMSPRTAFLPKAHNRQKVLIMMTLKDETHRMRLAAGAVVKDGRRLISA